MTLFDGITRASGRDATGSSVNVLERAGDDPAHDRRSAPSSSSTATSRRRCSGRRSCRTCRSDLRVIAIDLRGFGGTEHAPIDATRGVRDFSDDMHATLRGRSASPTAHLVGWSMGGGVVMQYALDHPVLEPHPAVPGLAVRLRRHPPRRLAADRRRRRHAAAGSANPDFVQRLIDHDTTADAPTSPR